MRTTPALFHVYRGAIVTSHQCQPRTEEHRFRFLLGQFSNHTARIACREDAFRDVFGNDATGSDD